MQKIRCEVTEPRSVLKWEFISVDYDIAFGVYHKSDKKQKEQVVCYWSSKVKGEKFCGRYKNVVLYSPDSRCMV